MEIKEVKMDKNIYNKIRIVRNKLNKSIKKNGIDSIITRKISKEIDALIKEYYNSIKEMEYPENSMMTAYYKQSYNALKEFTTKAEHFPEIKEWNKFAEKNHYLSHISLEYISKRTWRYLEIKVKREIRLEI